MPQNGYSIGRDITLNLVTSSGTLQVTGITSFKSKQETTEEKVKQINGTVDNVRFFEGWSGTFMIERKDATLDQYFCQIEQDYFAGIQDGYVTITETITEQNGNVSQFRYRKVLLKLDDAGEWAGDKTVKRSMSFVASRKINVS